MDSSLRKIDLFKLADHRKCSSEFKYWFIAEVDYSSMMGMGDVAHDWTFFCLNKRKKPVLIRESYDIYWNKNGCGSEKLTESNLCEITVEELSRDEADLYFFKYGSVPSKKIFLPIELHRQGKTYKTYK